MPEYFKGMVIFASLQSFCKCATLKSNAVSEDLGSVFVLMPPAPKEKN